MPAAPDGPAEALRRLAAHRDPEAWAWLLERLGPAMRAVAGRLSDDPASADDAVQEALLTVRDHAGSFRPRSEPDADARRWILRVAANAALNLRRGRRRAVARDRSAGGGGAVADRDAVEREETARIVRNALGELGEGERAAIVLHVVGGLGYDQVAAELRCPIGTAKTRVHRGLERLRRRLGPRAQALSIAAIAALLSQTAAGTEALPSSATKLLDAAARRAAPPPSVGHGLALGAKLAIAAAVLLAIMVPVGFRAVAHADAVEKTQVAETASSNAMTEDLSHRPRLGDLASRAALAVAPHEEPARSVAPTAAAATADRGDHRPVATAVPLDQAPPEAQGMLDGTVTLMVRDMSARDAAKWMGELCQVPIEVDPALAAKLATFRFEDVPFRSAAAQLADQIGGQCEWQDRGIRIVPKVSGPPVPREKL